MARIARQRNTAQGKQPAAIEGGRTVRVSVVINSNGTPVPMADGVDLERGGAFDPRGDELVRVISRIVQSGELSIGEGDRFDIELEFTGQSYKSGDFSERVEAGIVENWGILSSEGIIYNAVTHKSFKSSYIRFEQYKKNSEDKSSETHAGRSGKVGTGSAESSVIGDQGKTIPDPIYDHASGEIEESIRKARNEAAARLLPILKAAMQKIPHGTYDRKKTLVKWCNAELRKFNFSFVSLKTGLVSTLLVKTGNDKAVGAFQLKGEDAEGNEKTFTTPELTDLLNDIRLIDAPARREALVEWRERLNKQGRGPLSGRS